MNEPLLCKYMGEAQGGSHARLDSLMTAAGVAQGRFIGYLPKYGY